MQHGMAIRHASRVKGVGSGLQGSGDGGAHIARIDSGFFASGSQLQPAPTDIFGSLRRSDRGPPPPAPCEIVTLITILNITTV